MRTIAICDDDERDLRQAAQVVQRYADEAGHDVQLVLLDDAEECIRRAADFDAAFMDIEFQNGPLGIDAAARINEVAPRCQIVYLTNYLHYSLDVYGTDHTWYVLKSQLEQRLPEVFQKLALLDEARNASLVVKTLGDDGIMSVPCDNVRYLERKNRITRIELRDGTHLEARERIVELLAKMPESWFARCHNSFAVNLNCVKAIRTSEIDLEDGSVVPMSRSFARKFRIKYLMWAETRTV